MGRTGRQMFPHAIDWPGGIGARSLKLAVAFSPILNGGGTVCIAVDLPHCGPTLGTVVRLTPSHVAISFRGLVVVSKLYNGEPARA